jgi:hypothetical protein
VSIVAKVIRRLQKDQTACVESKKDCKKKRSEA